MTEEDYEFYHNRLLEITSDITDLGQEAYNTSESMPLFANEPCSTELEAIKVALSRIRSLSILGLETAEQIYKE